MMFFRKKLAWMVGLAAIRFVLRKGASKTIENERDRLAERLPKPLVDVADRLPVDPLRTASSVLAASKATKTVASTSGRAGKVARKRYQSFREVTSSTRRLGEHLRHQIDNSTRDLTSEYLRVTKGQSAADDAMLDTRRPGLVDSSTDEPDPLDSIPNPVASGRRRWKPALPKPKVNRMQRSYSPKTRRPRN